VEVAAGIEKRHQVLPHTYQTSIGISPGWAEGTLSQFLLLDDDDDDHYYGDNDNNSNNTYHDYEYYESTYVKDMSCSSWAEIWSVGAFAGWSSLVNSREPKPIPLPCPAKQ